MSNEIAKARRGIRFALLFTSIIWTIEAFDYISAFDFEDYGILPRTLKGTIGIVTAPLIHGDIYHLISNTFPILILIIGVFYFYQRIAIWVFFLIYFMTGFWVWIAARDAYHIGASGLVYGLISFLLFSGFIRRDPATLAVSFVVLILYGSNMVYGLIPGNERVSWESHMLGAFAGLFCAIYFKPKKEVGKLIKAVNEPDNRHLQDSSEQGYFSVPPDAEYHIIEKSDSEVYSYTIDDREP